MSLSQSQRTRWIRGDRCGVDNCKSTRYRNEDGQTICSNGHHREGDIHIAEDEDHAPGEARGKRRKIQKRLDERPIKSKVLYGLEGKALYLRSFQVVLAKQTKALVRDLGLPAELEMLVRDMWVLYLTYADVKLPEDEHTTVPDMDDDDDEEVPWQQEGRQQHSQTNDDDVQRTVPDSRIPRTPSLVFSVVWTYLAILLLRLPITISDLHGWILDGRYPYMRAIQMIPSSMRERLHVMYWSDLDPPTTPRCATFHHWIEPMAKLFESSFGLRFPAINLPPILLSYVRDLLLPLEIYTAARKLASLLALDMHVVAKSKSKIPHHNIMALVLVATKLCFGLDDLSRSPSADDEPAAYQPDWILWQRNINARSEDVQLQSHDLQTKINEVDVLDMGESEIDGYIAWCAQNWCLPDSGNEVGQHVLDCFYQPHQAESAASHVSPQQAAHHSHSTILTHLKALNSRPVHAAQRGVSRRPGAHYPVYNSDADLPRATAALLEAAARRAGVTMSEMLYGVRWVERKCTRLR
ncbi:hypothetical protein YB2330_003386 [Saitoella coloradoensis]